MTTIPVAPVAAPLTPAMAGVIAELHARCFGDATGARWSAEAIRTIADIPMNRVWLSQAQTCPAGVLLARAAGDDCEILTFGVLPEQRRAGHGRALMRTAAAWAHERDLRQFVLEVAVTNSRARRFYAACGFSQTGQRQGYYGGPEGRVDAAVMAASVEAVVHATGHILSKNSNVDL